MVLKPKGPVSSFGYLELLKGLEKEGRKEVGLASLGTVRISFTAGSSHLPSGLQYQQWAACPSSSSMPFSASKPPDSSDMGVTFESRLIVEHRRVDKT